MSHRASFSVSTDERVTTVDLTDRIERSLPGDLTGTCTVFVEHTTAGLCINEAEPRLLADIERAVTELAPESGWEHDEIDDNADAHVRSMLLGRSVTVPVTDGELDLGTWQSILLVECDGPRTRSITVTC